MSERPKLGLTTARQAVVAVLAGWLWASEPLNGRLLLSTVLILLAVLLVHRGERSANVFEVEAQPG